MITKANKVSILALMAGIFCKIYDDLNDNNLFFDLNLEKNKEYINEFLKMIHTALLMYISSYSIYPLLIFCAANLLLFFIDHSAFVEPYEYSGILLLNFILIIVLSDNINEIKNLMNYKTVLVVAACIGSIAFFDTYIFKNIEYGYKKLAVRGIASIFFLLVLIINHFYKYLQDKYVSPLCYFLGYCIASCSFQIYLIKKYANKKETIINVEKKEKNKPKKVLKEKQKKVKKIKNKGN